MSALDESKMSVLESTSPSRKFTLLIQAWFYHLVTHDIGYAGVNINPFLSIRADEQVANPRAEHTIKETLR